LVDWAIRGSCEVIRLVLEHIKIPYKEEKYVYKTKDKWFKEDRTKLREKHPHIELPYLKDGERIVCGTEAIIIYILHKYNRT
jgi:glutathione S-transferase